MPAPAVLIYAFPVEHLSSSKLYYTANHDSWVNIFPAKAIAVWVTLPIVLLKIDLDCVFISTPLRQNEPTWEFQGGFVLVVIPLMAIQVGDIIFISGPIHNKQETPKWRPARLFAPC